MIDYAGRHELLSAKNIPFIRFEINLMLRFDFWKQKSLSVLLKGLH
jgi:hypothetical protein